MDDTDRAVRAELDRRLAVLDAEERDTPRPAFPSSDMMVLIAVVVVSVLVGLIVGLS